MIRIFPDFSVQVTAAAGAGAAGMPAARVPGATNGNPQNVQGLTTYQQRQNCFQLQLSGVVAPVAEEASATAHTAKRRWKNAAKRARKGGFTQRRRGRTPPGQAHHVTVPCEKRSPRPVFTTSR
ncbi:hypothetical protein QTP70_033128 [Hemibagrus guttatus]|uniref:Uncharacterized protein n=1 Tax=Hemibagrus guttatus TaxID=175788 RepID=A0AAE0V3S1_9TELE|nr:hypothetical protein QTP70_033128 [Hemibagrus guttatus]KAK3563634.1 hypothetical protein QTP86_031882 [Hemibagrus guttatus]